MGYSIVSRPKIALAAAVAAALGAQSHAQTQPPAQVSRVPDAADDLEEVVVYGRFQQSLVNRIPISEAELPFTLNILDRAFLDARNFTRPIEALTTLPNITRTEDRLGTGTANFLSRGFEAPILVDNRVQNNFRGSGARDDAFVERYEVLKGPASIALGPIGAGGVINTVTKTPEDERFFDVELRADQFGSIGGEFDANVGELGVGSEVRLRISGAYRDFQFDADETARETIAIRPVVTANLGTATSLRASISYTENTVTPNTGFPLLSNGNIPSQIDTDTFTSFANAEGVAEDTFIEGELNHEFLDGLKLTVRGSHQETDFDYTNTFGLYNYNYADGVPGIGLDDPFVTSFTGGGETESEASFFDAQLAFQTELWRQQQDFVIGVASDERSFERSFAPFGNAGPFSLDELGVQRIGPSEIGEVSPNTTFDSELLSAFAEAALRPNDWLTIIAGIRYDDVDQLSVRFRGPNSFETGLDGDEVTVRVGATAAVSDEVNIYVSFAEAFEPQFGIRRDNAAVGPELSDGFELGAKGSALDGILRFETGLFYTERQDVAVRDPSNMPGEFFTVNVGELRVQGFEFTGALMPTPGLNLSLAFGFTDIDVTEAGDDEVTAAVFPEVTGSSYLSYEVQAGVLEGLSIGGGFRYVGKREAPLTDFDSYTVGDINISYPLNDRMELAFDLLNFTDELYLENVASFAQALTGGLVLGPPRTAVVTFRGKF
ncbi:MAG: TonB-dependent receptor [Pseudomonadota bacterium]